MFPTFTGNARRRPQVNLSGRQNQNPFAQNPGSSGPGRTSHGAPSGGRDAALVNAQQDRLARQQERDRTKAATLVQSKWRGNVARKALRRTVKARWDTMESATDGADTHMQQEETLPPYASLQDAISQMRALLYFIDLKDREDVDRLQRLHIKWMKWIQDSGVTALDLQAQAVIYRLIERCLESLPAHASSAKMSASRTSSVEAVTPCLRTFVAQSLFSVAESSISYYKHLRHAFERAKFYDDDLVTIPLKEGAGLTSHIYVGFALAFLTNDLRDTIGHDAYRKLASGINCPSLSKALSDDVDYNSYSDFPILHKLTSRRGTLCLLTNIIYIHRQAHGFEMSPEFTLQYDFIRIVGFLLQALVDEIEVEPNFDDLEDDDAATGRSRARMRVTDFEKEQLTSLLDQHSIRNLPRMVENEAPGKRHGSQGIRILVGYVLTLLRLYPRRANEIRMWLYMGSSSDQLQEQRLPVINYFWEAIGRSGDNADSVHIFNTVVGSPYKVVDLLKPRPNRRGLDLTTSDLEQDNQWRIILLFMEMYNFVLLIMDDEEFIRDGNNTQTTRTVTFKDISRLIMFLKNLGFAMYYQAPEITGGPNRVDVEENLTKLFRKTRDVPVEVDSTEISGKEKAVCIAGVQEASLEYVKGLVTGLLRQLYARDSRRPFLPKGSWLLSRLDMTNFIDAVVEEEERRRHIEVEDEAEDTDASHLGEHDEQNNRPIFGTRTQNSAARHHLSVQQQRQASRKRYLEAVAPRQQILQNMPFLIPFTTRVQIFRRFVHLDQYKRRNGLIDPDMWQHMNPGPGARHHANIRREHEFDDAFEQYYALGSALKEPIQITFVDKFGSVEAGIDGGGVTKEFLTSVTTQIFSQTEGVQMFAENDQHLLYPNPSALDETRELVRIAGFDSDALEMRTQVVDMLNRYEFLGRIIGKCLYENVLIDVGFAGFFLLKWALFAGAGFAPRESGYRASLNDLRDYDEGLYQGLLKLKNYNGNVEDFALNFTIADTLNIPGNSQSKTVTRDLKKGGSNLSVTNANRLVYIQDVARHRLQSQPLHQTNAFLRGLSSIIEPSWLSMFNQSELQTLIGGARQSISIPDLRKHTIYGGVYVIGDDNLEHPAIQMFWQVMNVFSDEDRGKVLKFVTSTPRAPLLGFGSLSPRFSIRDGGSDTTRLPSTSTCVNLLKLPIYKDAATLKVKLLQAVNSGAGFDLS